MTCCSQRKQQGVVLIVALVFLLILAVAGASAIRLATLEERMTGNASDRNQAFQLAESVLLEAEDWVRVKDFQLGNFLYDCSEEECFTSECPNGLCFSANTPDSDAIDYRFYAAGECRIKPISDVSEHLYQNPEIWSDNTKHRRSSFDLDGDGPLMPGKYIIEFLCFTVKAPDAMPDDQFDQANKFSPLYWEPLYRITVLALGRKPSTRIMLQTTFRRE